jgi:hypothetical protein
MIFIKSYKIPLTDIKSLRIVYAKCIDEKI